MNPSQCVPSRPFTKARYGGLSEERGKKGSGEMHARDRRPSPSAEAARARTSRDRGLAPRPGFQPDPGPQRTAPLPRAILQLANQRGKTRNGRRPRSEPAVERPAAERTDRVHQAPILGGEKRAGAVGAQGGPFPTLTGDLTLQQLPLGGGDGRLPPGALEMAALRGRRTAPSGKRGVGFLENRECALPHTPIIS